jgi:Glycosyl transferases group 1
VIGEEPVADPRSAPDAPNDDDDDELEREHRRARRSAADARHAEREVLELKDRLSSLTAELKVERQRYRALSQRRSTRLAVAVSRLLRGAARRMTGRPRPSGETQPPPTAAPPEPPVNRAVADPRSAPRLYREALLASLLDPRAQAHPLRVTLVGDPPAGLRSALTARGYEVRAAQGGPLPESWPDGGDVTVVADPAVDPIALPTGVVRVAWTASGAAEWTADVAAEYDVIVSTAHDPGRSFVDAVERWLRATRVGIRVPPGSVRTAARWGDTYLARDMRAALRTAGWPTRMYFHDHWNDPGVGEDDVVIDLLGRYIAETRPGAVRVLWQISHPEQASPDLYRSYDLVFIASDTFARLMAEQVPDLAVRTLHQATDPDRFCPTPRGPAHELLYVANWRAGRPIVEDLLPTNRRLSVFGRGWTPDHLDPMHHAGESIANDQLGPYYAAASIVLNDHAAGMRREGFMSNRLYDAAAAGALVITDEVDGVAEEFDGGVLVYRDRAHLNELIDRYLADPEAARALGERARRAVLERHTFAHRARTLIAAIEPLLERVQSGDRV